MLTQQEVENLAKQYYPKIASAITAAFGEYMSARALLSVTEVVNFKERTCGSIIHDLLKVKLKQEIGDDPDVSFGEYNNIFGIVIQGQIFIRFNKINEELFSSGAQSGQRDRYNNQIGFAGLGDDMTYLYAGYLPDRSWTTIKNIYLVCRSGNIIIWHKDLTSEVKQTAIFAMEEESQQVTTNRVSVKKGSRKTGTD